MTQVGTIRFTPFRELDLLRDMTRFAARFAGDGASAPNWTPPVDVFDTAEEVVVNVELPGFAPEAIDIEVDDNILVIRGERTFAEPAEGAKATRVERSYGHFARSLTLPQGVRTEDIAASFEHGVLTVRVPKAPEVRPRKIVVAGATEAPAETR